MRCVILAGGRGTRLMEETVARPKPMVEIGGRPILWHIMKSYSHHGVNDFVICLGYMGYVIKEWFANYYLHNSDMTVDLETNQIEFHTSRSEPWRVTLVDTGADTMTGGRLLRARAHLGDGPFCLTYGDGLSNVDIGASIAFHRAHEALVTMTIVKPTTRFGGVDLEGDVVTRFHEKPLAEADRVNGGFFVVDPRALDAIAGDQTPWEQGPLDALARDGQLRGFRHDGFWHPMDTLREREMLEQLWANGEAPWKVWS